MVKIIDKNVSKTQIKNNVQLSFRDKLRFRLYFIHTLENNEDRVQRKKKNFSWNTSHAHTKKKISKNEHTNAIS